MFRSREGSVALRSTQGILPLQRCWRWKLTSSSPRSLCTIHDSSSKASPRAPLDSWRFPRDEAPRLETLPGGNFRCFRGFVWIFESLGIGSLKRLPHLQPNGSKNVLHGHRVLLVLQGDVGRDGSYGMQHTFSLTNNDYSIKHPHNDKYLSLYLYIDLKHLLFMSRKV